MTRHNDIYATIDSTVFGFSHAGWVAYVQARAQEIEADVFDHAEIILDDDPDEETLLPDELRDTDCWTPAEWQEEFERVAYGHDFDDYAASDFGGLAFAE